ncbi:MAG: class I SAM-dependent methyltransferase [Bdellovibrionota bacterium]
MLRQFFTKLKENTVELNYGRDIIATWARDYSRGKTSLKVLDIGMGSGTDLTRIRSKIKQSADIEVHLTGLDNYAPNVAIATKHGIEAKSCDIERDKFPYADQSLDIVVANQVVEHTKEIFWIYSEISRVLKPDGIIITGVPNLASFHNRVGLAFGMQPTSIEVMGPHVRGFTAKSFINFLEADGYFKNISVKGSNFYPFPAFISKYLSRFFPKASVAIFLLTQRTDKHGLYKDVLQTRFFETSYFIGKDA